jgi:hypothetical protein
MSIKEFLRVWYQEQGYKRQVQVREYIEAHNIMMEMIQYQRFRGASRMWIPNNIWSQLYNHYQEIVNRLKQEIMEQLLQDFNEDLFFELLQIVKEEKKDD